MKKLVLLCLLFLVLGSLSAVLAWQQPVTVAHFDNIQYLQNSLQTADNCHLLMWWQNTDGQAEHFLRLYDSEYQALWAAPLCLPIPKGTQEIVETSDSCFVLKFVVSPNVIKAHKISRSGELLWGSQGISVFGDFWCYGDGDLVADLTGGVYFASGGQTSTGKRIALQHIDAAGNLSLPSTGLTIESSATEFFSHLLILQDNSVVINWTIENTLKMQRVNSSGQLMWAQTVSIPLLEAYPWNVFCAYSDASFALCLSLGNYIEIQRYDYSGAAIWPEAVTALTFNSNVGSLSIKAILGADDSIFISTAANNSKFLQKVSSAGVVQYPGGINLTTDISALSEISAPLPDASGGCVVVTNTYSSQFDIKAIKITAAGNVTIIPVTDSSFPKDILTASKHGDSIYIEWLQSETMRRGIRVQILDAQLQPQLASNGMELVYGSAGLVKNVQTAARTDGSSVTWIQADLNPAQWDQCLQIYTSSGVALLGSEGIRVNNPGSYLSQRALVHCNDSQTMVVWEELNRFEYTVHYQIFDGAGNILLPEGGLTLESNGQTIESFDVDTDSGNWYIFWSAANVIWGQKICGTQVLWGNGIQITQLPVQFTGYFNRFNLEFPWLSWSYNNQPRQAFVACIDNNGAIKPGFPAYGLELPNQIDSYYFLDYSSTVCADNLHVVLSYYDSDWEPSPDKYMHTLISPEGLFLFPRTEIPVSGNYNVFSSGTDFYIGDYQGGYVVRKYDSSGSMTEIHTLPVPGITGVFWEVLGARYLSNGNLLLLSRSYWQGSLTVRYAFITPEWTVDLPGDNIVFRDGASAKPSVSLLGDRAWIAHAAGRDYYSYESAGVFLQGVVMGSSANPDDEPSAPELLRVESCIPNPFNPETRITINLPQAGKTRLTVYDLRGRKIRVLVDSKLPVGRHSFGWDGKNSEGKGLASGVYILRLEAGGKGHSRKVTLIK